MKCLSSSELDIDRLNVLVEWCENFSIHIIEDILQDRFSEALESNDCLLLHQYSRLNSSLGDSNPKKLDDLVEHLHAQHQYIKVETICNAFNLVKPKKHSVQDFLSGYDQGQNVFSLKCFFSFDR